METVAAPAPVASQTPEPVRQVETAPTSEVERVAPAQIAVAPQTVESFEAVDVPDENTRSTSKQAPAPEPDTLAALPQEATASAAQPETGDASDLIDPDVDTGAPKIETSRREAPVTSSAPAAGLQVPGDTPSLSVSTDPAQPPIAPADPELALSIDPVQPMPPRADDMVFGGTEEVDPPESPPGIAASISADPDQPRAPAVPLETQPFEVPAPVDDLGTVSQDAAIAADRDAEPDDILPVPPVETENQTVFAPTDGLAPPEEPSHRKDEMDPQGSAGSTNNAASEVVTNRLPVVRDLSAEEVNSGPARDVGPSEASLPRPVEQFAVRFDNSENKPVMAIVLMDEGVDLSRGNIGLPALRRFPYPVTFAVDAKLPDASERMMAYRAEGFEVLALVDLPAGASAQDAEVTLSVALEAVPEAVGVLEGVGEGVQGSRDAAQQVADILAQTGHGFVTQNNGLNTVQKLAAKSGVPSAVVFRDFDSAEQTPTVIRRFLDQAAFKAGREGNVIMLGRLREDTISALLIWGLQDRAKTVALSPVSATLQSQ
ncbi:hypothetical protein ROLI_018540 [Roseobacter fucihabitans]|uniref:YibQ protein n=1 Tax=Roseobacter fucihabitans TaxID=1537242 RepID=A0ABZ2BTN7_9RHOB|nr:divergent polysaccharide deacetylase family protein [Roseobacter litoralis]MBC6965613.1 Divergent polysaccharide deacetylase [Roseobacter litoralis]